MKPPLSHHFGRHLHHLHNLREWDARSDLPKDMYTATGDTLKTDGSMAVVSF